MIAPALPSLVVLRAVEHLHGHLGWLAVAALAHPAFLLRNPRRRAPLVAVAATSLVTVVGALGAWLYPSYRVVIKRALFVESTAVGYLFERKEHLAVAVVAFAWVGMILHLRARLGGVDASPRESRESLAKAAHVAYVAAAIVAFAVATLGTIVASTRTF